jgi:hypothetical protein
VATIIKIHRLGDLDNRGLLRERERETERDREREKGKRERKQGKKGTGDQV